MRQKYVVEIFLDAQKPFSSREIEQIEDLVGREIGYCFDLIDNPDAKHIVLICNILLDAESHLEVLHKSLTSAFRQYFPNRKFNLQSRWTMVDALPAKIFKSYID